MKRSELAHVELGAGPSVVFVHGGLSDYRAWSAQMGPFSEGRRAVAYSRRLAFPNGALEARETSVESEAEDLAALIEGLGLAPAHLIGHSFGGLIVLRLARAHPRMVRSLVLCEPAIPRLILNDQATPGPRDILRLLRGNPEALRSLIRFRMLSNLPMERALARGDEPGAMRLFMIGVEGARAFKRLPAEARAMLRDNISSLRGDSNPSGFRSFTSEDARLIGAPALVVKGERSPAFLREIADTLSRCLQDREAITVAGASHFMFLENPEEFNRQVLRFLAKHG